MELLNARESVLAESLDLRVDDEGEFLMQPCGALQGTRCSVYRFRPTCCRTFECRLLKNLHAGKVTMTQAQAAVQETKRMIAEVNERIGAKVKRGNSPLKERYFAALEKNRSGSSELIIAMQNLEDRIETVFLK